MPVKVGGLRAVLLLGLFLLWWPRGAEGRQYFSREPEYSEVNPGAVVVLHCRVAEKAQESECVWQHDRLPVLLQPGKYEWAGQVDSGDCSLRVLRANIAYDDGVWECQVTSSSYQAGDGLSSVPAQLVVRQPPDQPRVFLTNSSTPVLGLLQLREQREEWLECTSSNGNPAPVIHWFLGERELSGGIQKNSSVGGRWSATSRIGLTAARGQHGMVLRCSVQHEALARRVVEENVQLDVQFPPSVRLERSPPGEEVEAGRDSLAMLCLAEGNPEPSVLWRKLGQSSIFRVEPELDFSPVRVEDEGTYVCIARNEVGTSDELSAHVTVTFPPRNVKIDPKETLDLKVGGRSTLTCSAEGSPQPRLEWLQLVEGGGAKEDRVHSRGKGPTLTISNVTYENQGLWRCSATNSIKGEDRVTASQVLRLGVTGQPLPRSLGPSTVSQKSGLGDSVEISQQYCSDPPARQVRWEWGSLSLGAGSQRGRFLAGEVSGVAGLPDCYSASLTVQSPGPEDSRHYRLVAENGLGRLEAPVLLTVTDPVSMATVLGVAAALLLLAVLAAVLAVLARRRHWCCWRQSRGHFQPQPDIKIERRPERQESDPSTSSLGERTLPLTTGLGREVTYQGHAGQGRPVPAPLYQGQGHSGHSGERQSQGQSQGRPVPVPLYPVPKKTPQNADLQTDESDRGGGELVRPRRVMGVPTMYADLQFPRSSNFGSMKRRGLGGEEASLATPAHYARIHFSPGRKMEKAEL